MASEGEAYGAGCSATDESGRAESWRGLGVASLVLVAGAGLAAGVLAALRRRRSVPRARQRAMASVISRRRNPGGRLYDPPSSGEGGFRAGDGGASSAGL